MFRNALIWELPTYRYHFQVQSNLASISSSLAAPVPMLACGSEALPAAYSCSLSPVTSRSLGEHGSLQQIAGEFGVTSAAGTSPAAAARREETGAGGHVRLLPGERQTKLPTPVHQSQTPDICHSDWCTGSAAGRPLGSPLARPAGGWALWSMERGWRH